jgi:hypothetical protein
VVFGQKSRRFSGVLRISGAHPVPFPDVELPIRMTARRGNASWPSTARPRAGQASRSARPGARPAADLDRPCPEADRSTQARFENSSGFFRKFFSASLFRLSESSAANRERLASLKLRIARREQHLQLVSRQLASRLAGLTAARPPTKSSAGKPSMPQRKSTGSTATKIGI